MIGNLTALDLEIPRTKSELVTFISGLVTKARDDSAFRHSVLKKNGVSRKLQQEVMPVLRYCCVQYPDVEVRIAPVIGNQGYDANVYDHQGKIIECIEVTMPIDGKAESIDTAKTIKRGYGDARVYGAGDEVRQIAPLVLKTAHAKSKKDYSGCTLLIVLHATPPFEEMRQEFDDAVAVLVGELKNIQYAAKRVVLLTPENRIIPIQ
jgi:hypothetical protein